MDFNLDILLDDDSENLLDTVTENSLSGQGDVEVLSDSDGEDEQENGSEEDEDNEPVDVQMSGNRKDTSDGAGIEDAAESMPAQSGIWRRPRGGPFGGRPGGLPGDDSDDGNDDGDDVIDADFIDFEEKVACLNSLMEKKDLLAPIPQCSDDCKSKFKALGDTVIESKRLLGCARIQIDRLQKRIKDKNRTIRDLRKERARLQRGKGGRGGRKTQVTWPAQARTFVEDSEGRWSDIYHLSCLESNCSPNSQRIHPLLNFRAPMTGELTRNVEEESDDGSDSNSDVNRSTTITHRRSQPEPGPDPSPFKFKDLPPALQLKILSLLLVYPYQMIHAISRLDPFVTPTVMHRNVLGRESLMHKFHVGPQRVSSVSITYAKDPQDVLKFLLGRFAKGIKERLQRVQHIELLWIGSRTVIYSKDEQGKFVSSKTQALMWLPQAIRLQTLGIWLQESSAPYMRRQHEPKALIKYMADVTKKQPNCRRYRCLRLIQGLDYLLCLRGLKQVNFWDYDRWLAEKQKKNIRDWTFAMDVNNAVQRGKRMIEKVQSQLRNLTPLVAEYLPNDEEWLALENSISVSLDQPQPPDGQVPLQPNVICIDDDDDEEEIEYSLDDGDDSNDSDDNSHDNDDHDENENDPDPSVDEDFGQYGNGVLSPSPSPSLGPSPSPGRGGHGVYDIGDNFVDNYDGLGIGGFSDDAMDVDSEADTSSEEPSGDAGENTDLSGSKDDDDGLFVADNNTGHEADDEDNDDEDGSITGVSIPVPRNGGGGGGGSCGGAAIMEMDFEDEERRASSGSRGASDMQMSFDFHECVDLTSGDDDGDDATDSASMATPLIDLTEANDDNNGSGISRSPSEARSQNRCEPRTPRPSGPGSVTRESSLFVGDTPSVSARSGSQTPGNRVPGSPFGHSNGAPGSPHEQDSGVPGSPYTNRLVSRWSNPRTPRARSGHYSMMPPPSRSVREESSLFVSPSTHLQGAREESMRLGTPDISARDVREESSLFVTPSRFERESAGPSERATWFISPSARDNSARLSRADDSASVFFDDATSAGSGEKRRGSEGGGSEPDGENPKRARNM
ncbi:hypothetical protein S40288_04794 [Stachybotrys chartarum IBT 40288]|nr:hypothetical protein S40288_04794 [Stachybotrys chartarum IBT 40288]